MSRGPAVHEIFSNALGDTSGFQYDEKETKENLKLSKKKTAAPMPPMKKFGGYKPKILGGEEDFIQVEREALSEAKTSLSPKTRPAPVPQLTKPKPWVIGDKNVPMVLSTVGVDDDVNDDSLNENGNSDDNNNSVDNQQDDSNVYNNFIENDDEKRNGNDDASSSRRTYSVSSSETSTLIQGTYDEPKQGIDNPAASINDTMSLDGSTTSPTTYANNDGAQLSLSEDGEPEGVFIPAPDYDEDEQTLDFTSEDTDDGGEDTRPRQNGVKKAGHPVKIYEGEDLSHYLPDDEDIEESESVVLRNNDKKKNHGRKAKTEAFRPRVSNRHSLFNKEAPTTKGKRKSGSGKTPPPPQSNSNLRSFSYADSKFGTVGGGKGKKSAMTFSELTDESDVFISANTQRSSYESFLRTRNGEQMSSETSNDSGVGLDENDTQLRQKDDPVWKKLTLRIKNRMSKSGSIKEH